MAQSESDTPRAPEVQLLHDRYRAKDVTLAVLAERTQLSPSTLGFAISGRKGSITGIRPTDVTLARLAPVLDITSDQIRECGRDSAAELMDHPDLLDVSTDPSEPIEPPAISRLLHQAYSKAKITAGDIAVATGMSRGSVHVALDGWRKRGGVPTVIIPPDATVVKIAAVLHIDPDDVAAAGRPRAADLMRKIDPATTTPSDLEAQSVAVGRAGLARQVLAAFSTGELQAEIQRRNGPDEDA